MNKPCWKAVNAQIRKKKADEKKVQERIEETRRNAEMRVVFCNEYRDVEVERIRASYDFAQPWIYLASFEERMETAKNEIFKKMKDAIMKAWTFRHINNGYYSERWEAEIKIVRGQLYR